MHCIFGNVIRLSWIDTWATPTPAFTTTSIVARTKKIAMIDCLNILCKKWKFLLLNVSMRCKNIITSMILELRRKARRETQIEVKSPWFCGANVRFLYMGIHAVTKAPPRLGKLWIEEETEIKRLFVREMRYELRMSGTLNRVCSSNLPSYNSSQIREGYADTHESTFNLRIENVIRQQKQIKI